MEREMFFGAYPQLFRFAEYLRSNMTPAEKLLWEHLRKNQLGYRFKAQHPVYKYIVDFYCHKLKMVIELDGPIHDFRITSDSERQAELQDLGLTILRFKNESVHQNITEVISHIEKAIEQLILTHSKGV